MAGYIQAPSPRGLIGAVDGDLIELGKEPVRVRAGVGTFVRANASDRELIVDGLTGAPAESISFAKAGTVTVADPLARYAGTRWGGVSYVTLAEASQLVAPTGADGTNSLALRVAGSAAGELVVPITGPYQATNNASQAPLMGRRNQGSSVPTHVPGGINGTTTQRGWAVVIVPTATQWVQSFTLFGGGASDFGYNVMLTAGWRKRVAVLDEHMHELVAYETTQVLDAGTWPFPYTVKLTQGRRYWFSILLMNVEQNHSVEIGSSGNSDNYTETFGYTPVPTIGLATRRQITNRAPTGTRWDSYDWDSLPFNGPTGPEAQVWPGTQNTDPNAYLLQVKPTAGGASGAHMWYSLNASGGGVAITGDITVSIVQRGTGPTDPGADLNGRILIASEGL